MQRLWKFVLFVLIGQICGTQGRYLEATSLVTCMQDSQISPSYFNVTFNPDDRSLNYNIDLTTEIDGYVDALVQVYAYGFLIIEKKIDVCSLDWKQFCPLNPGSLQIESVQSISASYANQIPGIAFTVPDIDAVVKVLIYDRTSGDTVSCLQASFSNGNTVAQTGAKWATAVVAGLGLLVAAVASVFGNSNAASHISANAVSLFLYFQSVVVVSMIAVERVPPIASAWAENLAWSMGLIRVTFMQKIFRWYVQSTGGSPDVYLTGTSKQILVQRALNFLNGIHALAAKQRFGQTVKRSLDFALHNNKNLELLRGIKRIGYNSRIEPTSIVATGFTFFVLLGYVLFGILIVFKIVLVVLTKYNKLSADRFTQFRHSFSLIVKGSLLRYLSIGFTQLLILSLWEFIQQDSPAVIVIAVLVLILVIVVFGYSFFQVIRVGRRSVRQFKNPAALLYGDSRVLNKYGFCYTMFNAKKYWFGLVLLLYCAVKAIFVGLCQASGKTAALVFFIVDLIYTAVLIYESPYLNKPTNIINYVTSVVTCVNSFLYLFFSDLFGQPAQVSSIMGWIFFIMNAAYSFCLLVMILVFIVLIVTSKNLDARFMPAKDDRASFQRQNSTKKYASFNEKSNELTELGLAAQDHASNWESDMYKLHEISSSTDTQKAHLTPSLSQNEFERDSDISLEDNKKKTNNVATGFGSKLMNKLPQSLVRATSLKKNAPKDNTVLRMSDTLLDNHEEDRFRDSTGPLATENSTNSISKRGSSISIGASSTDSNRPTAGKNFL